MFEKFILETLAIIFKSELKNNITYKNNKIKIKLLNNKTAIVTTKKLIKNT